MAKTIAVNKNVNVTAVYFKNGSELKEFPKRIEFEGNTYTFLESGFQYLIKKGQSITRVFDMTDGTANFRLKHDVDQVGWTLVNITQEV